MLDSNSMARLVGLGALEILEIEKSHNELNAQEDGFLNDINKWMADHIVCTPEPIVDSYYFQSLISGDYGIHFYRVQYHKTLEWVALGLTQSHVLLLNSQIRQKFVHLGNQLGSIRLAKALCNTLDVSQIVVSSVYELVDNIEFMKNKSEHEIVRIHKFYKLISSEAPKTLLATYVAHQKWKQVAFNLSLGRPLNWDNFEISPKKCLLAKWLDEGGLALLPESKRKRFLDEHENVHRLGKLAIDEAESNNPENIVEFLSKMEHSSDYVSQVILDLIEDEFLRLATADALTGMPNRRSFELALTKSVAFAKRNEFWLGLIVIDVDLFKKFNDTYGHSVGDEVLIHISNVMSELVRTEEQVFRWGGEEFAVITMGSDVNGAALLAERMRKIIEETNVKTQAGVLTLTVSCGVVSIDSHVNMKQEEIFSLADSQLYAAKEGGRNRVEHISIKGA